MATDLVVAEKDLSSQLLESVLLGGDLSKLTAMQRLEFYRAVCKSLGLNELSKPFDYILLNGKLRLYCTKDATDQLRKRDGISIEIMSREIIEDIYVVTARALNAEGRTDESIGAVPLGALKGEARSNGMMKAESKAKRRVTLSICGLGMLDASETDSIPQARRVAVDDAGEIKGELPATDIPDGGSREAQEQVKERKLAEVKKQPKPTHKPDPEKGWFSVMLEGFSGIKGQIGDHSYYSVLGKNGYEHANQIPNRETAMKIYKEMAELRPPQPQEETT
jgi:hypothetical protein